MSGDVQPRKRNKDKQKQKKREDDVKETPIAPNPTGGNATKTGSEDIMLHVHSDHGTGGHWCAKVVFFALLAVLAGLVGLIILENRGLSDLDTPLSESRFAQYLDGWVDENRDNGHDDHDIIAGLNELDDDHDDHDDEALDHSQEEDDESNGHDDEDAEDEAEAANLEQSDELDENDDQEVNDVQGDDNDDDDDDDNVADTAEDEDEDEEEVVEHVVSKRDVSQQQEAPQDDDDGDDQNDAEDQDDDDTPFEESSSKKIDVELKTSANDVPSGAEQLPGKLTNHKRLESEILKDQVDELYETYNKLAERLNKSNMKLNLHDPSIESAKSDLPINGNTIITNEPKIEILVESEEKEDQVAITKRDVKEDDDGSFEVIDNDEGEDELLEKLATKEEKIVQPEDNDDDEEPKSSSRTRSGSQAVDEDDYVEEQLHRANNLLDDNPKAAETLFKLLLKSSPNSIGALYGHARAIDRQSEQQQSNKLLLDAIKKYEDIIQLGAKVPDDIFKEAAERCIDRMRFIGQQPKAVSLHEALIERFPEDPVFRNQLAVTYLLSNNMEDAKFVLHETLLKWRSDGFALVHYGFVLKNLDKNMEAAVMFLSEGIESNATGTQDGRFYFHLGDALSRLGRNEDAMNVYRKAAAKKLFLSEYQRSLYNVDRLKSNPFWTIQDTTYDAQFNALEANWEKIRDEGLSILGSDGLFKNEAENLKDKGDWKQFELFARGKKMVKNCEKAPLTCKIIDMFPAARFCTRGQVKFSVMHPETHVWAHCGPTNCRIRAHLGLKVPEGTFIRVAEETRSWKEGKMLIFDDSFEHEVWHNGTSVRLVLIVDVWHPELTESERKSLHPI